MRLLLCLAEHPGEVVSIEDLLNEVWPGVNVSSDSVYQAVTSLRRQLGDDSRQPKYIETVPRLGYRMVAIVQQNPSAAQGDDFGEGRKDTPALASSGRRGWSYLALAVVATFALSAGLFFLAQSKIGRHGGSNSPALAAQPQNSVAVLPFLDLTEGMKDEEFADGMTEELIDKLSKLQNLRVPGATSSFYFKGKQVPVAEIAKALGVSYVLDGSVRKSGGQLRVAARLARAETGYVVWSETYNRPVGDILKVQDDIAGEVAKALSASIKGTSNRDQT